MITQLNLRHGIMVTFKRDPSIARAEATICICFVDDAMLDRCIGLDCLEVGSNLGWMKCPHGKVEWNDRCVKEKCLSDAFFLGESKANIFKFKHF